MCGRYVLSSPTELVEDFFDLPDFPRLRPRYNIAPTQEAPIVKWSEGTGRHASFARWGLVPSWASDASGGHRAINARSESVRSRPTFRDSFRKRRCLVPADGFYEWIGRRSARQPYLFRPQSAPLFAFAGLWDRWQRDEHGFESFTILTTTANEEVATVHDRMPVILEPSDHERWLDPAYPDSDALHTLLRPWPSEEIESFPVSPFVNNPAHEGEECIARTQLELL